MVGADLAPQPSAGVTPQQALREAVAALTAGRHDARLPDGAQANALEAIAWALVGLLAKESGGTSPDGARESLTDGLSRLGFMKLRPD